jgi:hypothetical protein
MAEDEMPPLVHPSIWQPEFVKLLHAVEGIFDGSVQDITHGGLYWGRLDCIQRPWFREHIIDAVREDGLRQHARVSDLNSLSFWA